MTLTPNARDMYHAALSNCSHFVQANPGRLLTKTWKMLGARASRLSQNQSRATGSSGTRITTPTTACLTSTTRLSLWKNLCVKILYILDSFDRRHRLGAILGKAAYKRIYNQFDKAKDPNTIVNRIIHGEIVGKPMKISQGDRLAHSRADTMMCQHPTEDMKRRGNKTSNWWTCKTCHSRWERLSLPGFEETIRQSLPTDVVVFGKHVGRTFKQVYEEDPQYCQWCVTTQQQQSDVLPGLDRFATWVQQVEIRIAECGIMETVSDSSWLSEVSDDIL